MSYGSPSGAARWKEELSRLVSALPSHADLLVALGVAAFLALAAFWSAWLWLGKTPQEESPPSRPPAIPQIRNPTSVKPRQARLESQADPGNRLQELSALLSRLQELDPQDLAESEAGKTSNPKRSGQAGLQERKNIRSLLEETLPRLRARLLDTTGEGALNLPHYLPGRPGATLPAQQRLKAIQAKLQTVPELSTRLCNDLRPVAEAEVSMSPLSEWCATLEAVAAWSQKGVPSGAP
ncbi:MAG: hypothetical protein V3T83_02935 [Acidobacteriota bacterium]